MSKIILASQSPRRKDLLTKMGLDFEAIPSNFVEYLDDNRDPSEVAIELALGKAMTVAKDHPNDIVIASDTIVTIDGHQLAKASDDDEAREILRRLSNKRNDVTSSLVVMRLIDNIKLTGSDTVSVFFLPYDEDKVNRYIATGDYKDKAGAYGIQSGAADLIDYMRGDFDTVLGMPTKLLAQFLAKLGLEVKPLELIAPVKQI